MIATNDERSVGLSAKYSKPITASSTGSSYISFSKPKIKKILKLSQESKKQKKNNY